ncbi:Protein of unknown function [Clostridium cavendishii DSM 21758]|uniref:DUF2922 domain-containing protein n=1 Tax=Clostridium cavendishii DSM 21758 TaxID=1121302 RepID=A0A1M6J362_9CLOT|nr:DUF2922 domain-containing protein [Clostridium cavendishii]SHJ41099.1 Protein of unknown function [Clostridium cavendishii DSM 21758]
MSKRNLTLVMTFKNSAGNHSNISINGVKENLTEADINGVMDTIIAKNVFTSKGGNLVAKLKADIVDKTTSTFEFK